MRRDELLCDRAQTMHKLEVVSQESALRLRPRRAVQTERGLVPFQLTLRQPDLNSRVARAMCIWRRVGTRGPAFWKMVA